MIPALVEREIAQRYFHLTAVTQDIDRVARRDRHRVGCRRDAVDGDVGAARPIGDLRHHALALGQDRNAKPARAGELKRVTAVPGRRQFVRRACNRRADARAFALQELLRAERGGGAVEGLRNGTEFRQMALDEAGVELLAPKAGSAAERGEEPGIIARADDNGLVERVRQPVERFAAIFAMRDQLGNHRIVERRDVGAFFDAGIDAQALDLRKLQCQQFAGRGQKTALGIFGVKPRLDRVAQERHFFLCERQLFAGRDAELPLHKIEPGDGFGDRMLDLQPRVHLHEPEAALFQPTGAVGDEFDGAGAFVTGGLGGGDGGFAHARAQGARSCRAPAPPRSPSDGGVGASNRVR